MKWSKEKIIEYVNNTDKYIFIEFLEYNGISSLIKVECKKNKKHGSFDVKFNNLKSNEDRKRKNGCCDKCKKETLSDKNSLPYEVVKERIEVDGHILISETYVNKNEKLDIKCPICNDIFSMSYNNFHHHKQRCPKCSFKEKFENQVYSYEFIKNEIEKTNEYLLLSNEYIGCWNELEIKCLKHNKVFYKSWHSFQQGKRCNDCGMESRTEKQRHSIEYVREYIESQGDKLLSDKYINNIEKLEILCKKGHIFTMGFGSYVTNHRCPICNESKGEKRISEILDNFNILYTRQKTFDDCRFKNKLPFDFYLPKYNCCIEFDGEQHFEIVEHFNGLEGFVDRKIRDTIKNIYCQQNNIKLVRISYKDFNNIEKIICKELNLI